MKSSEIMKEVTIKASTRVCSKGLNGCGRTIKTGEKAMLQVRTRLGRGSRRYLCMECYDKNAR